MEKTITVAGKEVRLKSNGATPIKYKMQFRKDFFAEILKLHKLGKLKKKSTLDDNILSNLDFNIFYDFTWVLAKTADHSIPDPIKWLEEFDTFPILEILPDIQEMLMANLYSKKK